MPGAAVPVSLEFATPTFGADYVLARFGLDSEQSAGLERVLCCLALQHPGACRITRLKMRLNMHLNMRICNRSSMHADATLCSNMRFNAYCVLTAATGALAGWLVG